MVFSALLRPTLEMSRVDVSRVRVVENSDTGVAVITVDSSAGGENRIVFSPGANYDGMQPTPEVLGMALAAPIPVIVIQSEVPVNTVIEILRDIVVHVQKKAALLGNAGLGAVRLRRVVYRRMSMPASII